MVSGHVQSAADKAEYISASTVQEKYTLDLFSWASEHVQRASPAHTEKHQNQPPGHEQSAFLFLSIVLNLLCRYFNLLLGFDGFRAVTLTVLIFSLPTFFLF